MGYNAAELRIPLRLDNHLGPETERDKLAAEALATEIQVLIDGCADYSRIAITGVSGP